MRAPGGESLAILSGDAVLRPLKTSEVVAREIVRDIVARGSRPGDSLPPENSMLELYGVSRESLREGLRLLEVQGLISIRRGASGGPVVGTVDPANLGRVSTLFYHLGGATYGELLEAWVMAEALLAERAARNPDAAARTERMQPYLTGHADDTSLGLADFVRAHTRFHAVLASLASNRVLEINMQTMGKIVSRHVATDDDPRTMRDMIERDHYLVARAVSTGHPRRARALMEQHIEAIASAIRARLGPTVDDLIEWR